MSTKPLLVAAALLTVLLSGCVSDEAPPTTDDPIEDPPGDTGTVRGEVASASLDLLEEADVYLVLEGEFQQTETDAQGRYAFEDVTPGTYRVQVSRVGFENQARSVEVAAGQTAEVAFLLEPLVPKDPSHQTLEFEGFFECAFGTVFITDTCTFAWRTAYDEMGSETGEQPPIPRDPSNNENTFPFFVGDEVEAIMTEMVWDDNTGTTEEMMMLLSSTPIDNACDCSEHDHIELTGRSPLRAVVGQELPDIYGDLATFKGSALWTEVINSDNGTAEVAARGFLPFDTSAGYGHAFTFYVTVFYNSIPDPDFTAIPDA